MPNTGAAPRLSKRSADSFDGVAALPKIDLHVHSEAVPSLEAHPLRKLRDGGAAITLNTDDPMRVRTSIRVRTRIDREYALALELGLSLGDLETITAQVLEASFTTEDRRPRVREWLGTVNPQGLEKLLSHKERVWVWVVDQSEMPVVRASSA